MILTILSLLFWDDLLLICIKVSGTYFKEHWFLLENVINVPNISVNETQISIWCL